MSVIVAGISIIALFVALSARKQRPPRAGLASAAAIFAAGAVAALALALTFALDKGWLTVGLALMVPGIAWISERRPLPALRYLAAAMIVRRDHRCRTVHLLGGMADFWSATVDGGLRAAIATGAARLCRSHCAYHRQGIPHRHGRPDRHFPRALLHRAWSCAGRHRLSLSARAVPH